MKFRNADPSDYNRVMAVIVEWWGGRDVRSAVYSGLFEHFRPTTFIVEDEQGELVAFLLGYLSQTYPDMAYINWIGVRPQRRREGIARTLYERFYEVARANGRTRVTARTALVNTLSRDWHARMGFSVEERDGMYHFERKI